MDGRGVAFSGYAGPPPQTASGVPADDPLIIHRWCLKGRPDILEYTDSGRRYRWCSTRNYYSDTEDAVARATGYEWRSRSDADDTDQFNSADAGDRALMWLHAIQSLVFWWRDKKAGPFPMTMPGMAQSLLYSRIPPKYVSTHTNHDIIRLEREACHGGRATAWFTGDVRPKGRHGKHSDRLCPSGNGPVIPGPIHHYDVRSMYPYLMGKHTFPVSLYKVEHDVSPERLADALVTHHAVAHVHLDTEIPEYPCRRDGRVIYPVGRFSTVLATPELQSALREKSIRRVSTVAYYNSGRPFELVAAELLAERQTARDSGNQAWELFVKGVANAMTGKLAQRKGEWIICPDKQLPTRWGEELEIDHTCGTVTRYRTLAGLVWRLSREERGNGTLTAAYAVLTAYGRRHMSQLRTVLPLHSVLSQDTDGLWVTASAARVIDATPCLVGESAGLMRLVRSVTSARFWDSKHYYAGGVWVVAGFAVSVPRPGTVIFADAYVSSPLRGSPLAPPDSVMHVTVDKCLNHEPSDGHAGQDGWLQPYRLPCKLPWQTDQPVERQPTLFPDS